MAETASEQILVQADPAAVMAVIADFSAYPQWVDLVQRAEVLGAGPDGRASEVRFVVDAGLFSDDYVLHYDWTGDTEVRWRLVRSKALKAQDGSYRLTDTPDGTAVTYTLAVELAVPVLGVFKRKAQQVIVDSALRGLKQRVESTRR